MPKILILVTSISLLINSAFGEEATSSEKKEVHGEIPSLNSWPAYKQLFETKRKAHLDLIKTILSYDKAERQYQMIDLLYKKMKEVLKESRSQLTDTEYDASETDFPTDTSIRDAMSQIIENSVLFSDLTLRFPTIVHRSFDRDELMKDTISWSFRLINKTKAVVDTSAEQAVRLASQELRLIPKDPDFTNPFNSESEIKISTLVEEIINQRKLKKKKTGPRLSKTEL